MDTFTLTQQKESIDVFLYPSGDLSSCTELTAYGIIPNYACVDEETTDEDSTYVYNNTPTLKTDLYELPNQSLSGTINYIQVFTRAKSHTFTQHMDGIYKIICSPDSVCTHIYKSNNINNLTSSYAYYNYVWTENPSTVTDWTWGDIDTLCIGVECSSPTVTWGFIESTFRPNAVGDKTEQSIYKSGCTAHYLCVDETVADYLTTAVFASSNFPYTSDAIDIYNIPDHTTESGTINSIKIFAYVMADTENIHNWARTVIKTGGTEYQCDETYYLTKDVWQLISTTYTKNPDTGVKWTWADIDALQIGDRLHAENGTIYCTQVYAVVNYTPSANPDIRTTQCYAIVNYNLPADECILNKPTIISFDHDRNVKMLNFWDGSREVYDLSRNSKSVVMMGEEFFEPSVCSIGCPCERILCVRNMGLDGSTITVSGFTGIRTLANDTYKIRSFGWKKTSNTPIHYSWILELENTAL